MTRGTIRIGKITCLFTTTLKSIKSCCVIGIEQGLFNKDIELFVVALRRIQKSDVAKLNIFEYLSSIICYCDIEDCGVDATIEHLETRNPLNSRIVYYCN
jgi:hypothetical protein